MGKKDKNDFLHDRRGIARLTFVLLVIVIAFCVIFIAQAYRNHVRDAKLFFDQDQVSRAIELAKIKYLEDGVPEQVTYYFDAEKSELTDDWELVSTITGYGRSLAAQNKNGETGAVGVPNRGGADGAQLLAVYMADSGDEIHVRWQGNRLTAYDYSLMTTEEQRNLNADQLLQIRLDENDNE